MPHNRPVWAVTTSPPPLRLFTSSPATRSSPSSSCEALLQELSLLSSVVSRAATLNINTDALDASTLEQQGQLARMQKQMMSLLHQFQLTESLISSLQSSPQSTLNVLQILSNVASFARSLVLSASANPRSTR